jgi:hypothetical protein
LQIKKLSQSFSHWKALALSLSPWESSLAGFSSSQQNFFVPSESVRECKPGFEDGKSRNTQSGVSAQSAMFDLVKKSIK